MTADTSGDGPEQRTVFGSVAELYHETRPSYPSAMYEVLSAHLELPREALVVDIGVGTGLSSRWFLDAGHRVIGVDPSASMLSVAVRANAAHARRFRAVEGDFESWSERPGADLAVSGQAWHWLDPDRRFAAAVRVLGRDGSLAVFWNRPDQDAVPWGQEIAEVYDRLVPEMRLSRTTLRLPGTKAAISAPTPEAEFDQSGLFGPVTALTHRWTRTMTADEHCRNLRTQSDHLLLPSALLERVLEGVREAIDRNGGQYSLPIESRCFVATRR